MLSGSIDVSGQIHVPIDPIATHGERRTLDALLDTGFTVSLGIRGALARSLGWQLHGYVEAALASGLASLAVCIGEVIFDGQHRVVRSVEISSDDVIIGLMLLQDKCLLADFRTRVVLVE
jgi:predicted aspartyl protease